ncbi:hypothetical protein CHH80_14950 [Bacillus sp. 7504-2]|nr:hypothetical protein CHH80_14950 [Bacillus sp. 7504-2]
MSLAIDEYIHFYHHKRYRQRLNGLSHMEYRAKAALNQLYYFHCLLDGVQFIYPSLFPLTIFYLTSTQPFLIASTTA